MLVKLCTVGKSTFDFFFHILFLVCFQAELSKKDIEISELKAKIRSMEDRLSEEKDLHRKRTTEVESEIVDLRAKVASLESRLHDRDGKQGSEVTELKVKVRGLEDQLKVRERLVRSAGREEEKEVSRLNAELKDARNNLRMRETAVERLEREKEELEKQVKTDFYLFINFFFLQFSRVQFTTREYYNRMSLCNKV